jgi:3-deoxy-D-manno-octulosonic-acid transferase
MGLAAGGLSLMRGLYSALIRCAAPLAFAVVLWRGLKDRSYWQGLTERFGWGAAQTQPVLWVHAVSLGEMNAAAPLVRALCALHPETPLVLTTATPAGRARAHSLFAEADIRFLPYDTPGAVRRFLARIKPRLAVIMETELWPNLYRECGRRGVPLLVANARLSPKSASRYRRFGPLLSDLKRDDVLIAAQSAADAARFADIGARHTAVVGNVKFDLPVDSAVKTRALGLRAQFGVRPVWIAGSTHSGEDEAVLLAHRELLKSAPAALLVLAPRHKERFEAVAKLLAAQGFPYLRRSAGGAVSDAVAVLLVDTLGELASLYGAADVAFVGGSLVPIGGHNLLEPAALGIPVLTGPYTANSRDIAALLLEQGAAREVTGAADLAGVLKALIGDPEARQRMGAAGQQIIAANRGSVQRLVELIAPWWAADPSARH